MALPAISCEELQAKLESDEPPVLVDALPPMSYAHSHLPGAINLVPGRRRGVAPRAGCRTAKAEIVVYCANPGV